MDVPITAADKVSVPPLKGFVMNRIAGDYFETLLYKVFVSIDEHTSVTDLATVLQVTIFVVHKISPNNQPVSKNRVKITVICHK